MDSIPNIQTANNNKDQDNSAGNKNTKQDDGSSYIFPQSNAGGCAPPKVDKGKSQFSGSQNNYNSANGNNNNDIKIGDYKQGNKPTCWLDAGIDAMRHTIFGAKALNNDIKKNPNGSTTINLPGVGKSYTFTQDEINKSVTPPFCSIFPQHRTK